MTNLWTAHPECPEHVKIELKTGVQSFLSFFLLVPISGKVFDNADVSQKCFKGGPITGLCYCLNR
jgi:hypothetical protein